MKANKVILLFLVHILFFKVSIAQHVTKENSHLDKSYSLYIKLNSKIDIESNEDLSNFILQNIPSLKKVYEDTPFQLKKGIPLSKDKLQDIENKGLWKRDGKRIGLNNILKVLIEKPTQEKLQSLKNRLDKIEAIEYCHLTSNIPVHPPSDIFPETPSFRNSQSYIDQNPGVNMQYAWDNGVDGTGIHVRNLEYGFNKSHEELNDVNAFYAPGKTVNPTAIDYGYTRHGTSVMGVLYADNGVYGVTGMVPGVEELILQPEWTEEYVTVDNPYGWDRIAATAEAISNTSAGDILIYEMQNAEKGPVELDPVLWDLTKAATDAGIIIVAAAGNGGLNLDSPIYNEYMSRGDSGAIIVGAGTPDVNHDALPFSSYGSRVDLQGWGNSVFTSGSIAYLEMIGGDVNQSYTNFTGTSSATAIVASCAVAIQSYYLNNTGLYLTGEEIKDILQSTGITQGTSTASNRPIGPLPNMETALNQLDNTINCSADIYGNFDTADVTFADGDQCTAFPFTHFNAASNSLFPWKAIEYYGAYHVLLTEDYWDDYGCSPITNPIVNQGSGTNIWHLGSSNPIDTSPSGNESVMAFFAKRKHYEATYSGVHTELNNLTVGQYYRLSFYDSPVSTPGGRQTPEMYYRPRVRVNDASGEEQIWDGQKSHYYTFTPEAANTWHTREVVFNATNETMVLTLEFPIYPDPNNVVNDGYVAIDDIQIECIANDNLLESDFTASCGGRRFQDTSIDNGYTITNWEWTLFNNGNTYTSTNQHPTFNTVEPGVYSVALKITGTNSDGTVNSDIAVKTVTISDDLVLDFTFSCNDVQLEVVTGITGGSYTLLTDYGDGAIIDTTTGGLTGGVYGETYTVRYTQPDGCYQDIALLINPTGVYGNFDNADATYADGDQCTAFPFNHFYGPANGPFPWKATIYYSAYHVLLTEDFYDDYNCNVLLNQGTGTNIWMNPHRIKTPPSGHESVMAYWNKSKHTDTNLSGVYTQINNLEPNTTYQIEFYDLPVRTHAPGRQTANLYYNTKVSFGNQEWNGPDTYYTNEDNYWHLRTMTFTTDATTTSTTLTLQFPLHPDLNNPVNDGYIAIDDIKITCLANGTTNRLTNNKIISNVKNEMIMFPNPTKGELNITLNTTDDEIQSVVVYNIQGQLILKENALKQNRLDISQIENGIYFVTIKTSKNKTYTKKIIKQ